MSARWAAGRLATIPAGLLALQSCDTAVHFLGSDPHTHPRRPRVRDVQPCADHRMADGLGADAGLTPRPLPGTGYTHRARAGGPGYPGRRSAAGYRRSDLAPDRRTMGHVAGSHRIRLHWAAGHAPSAVRWRHHHRGGHRGRRPGGPAPTRRLVGELGSQAHPVTGLQDAAHGAISDLGEVCACDLGNPGIVTQPVSRSTLMWCDRVGWLNAQ